MIDKDYSNHWSSYCVPNLKLDVFIIDLQVPCSELYSDGEIMLLSESLVSELKQ